ncbi:MAG: DUF1847 domain-containing protein [Prolixibacteraceae bacterium]|jgi:uncharacterized metal-binding protein|nr:DUF1847 domain-containing protein [Prolixibacteraceae bacterium]
MDCTNCKNKVCRVGEECAVVAFDTKEVVKAYHKEQPFVQAAAKLVDNGKAGTLSRLEETIEFAKIMDFRTIGLAYCYGMENDAKLVTGLLRSKGFKVEAASCTVGGIAQNDVNLTSNNCNVSCNPIGQAQQLNTRKPDLVLTMGLCLGHDILFNREIKADTTTLVVKDRVHQNQPSREFAKIEY